MDLIPDTIRSAAENLGTFTGLHACKDFEHADALGRENALLRCAVENGENWCPEDGSPVQRSESICSPWPQLPSEISERETAIWEEILHTLDAADEQVERFCQDNEFILTAENGEKTEDEIVRSLLASLQSTRKTPHRILEQSPSLGALSRTRSTSSLLELDKVYQSPSLGALARTRSTLSLLEVDKVIQPAPSPVVCQLG